MYRMLNFNLYLRNMNNILSVKSLIFILGYIYIYIIDTILGLLWLPILNKSRVTFAI